MQRVKLQRWDYGVDGTFGLLTLPNGDCLYTCELTWNDNEPFMSCIPEGIYRCIPSAHNGRPSWLLVDVPGRDDIMIHSANLPKQLQGCIAPGLRMGRLYGNRAVLASKDAMKQLEKFFLKKEFELEIIYKDKP